jgi:ABC-type bacteriocin/lantibiotic exporter with double-glycine peptidase domain
MKSLEIVKPFIQENKKLLIFYTLCILIAFPIESVLIPKIFSSFFKELNNDISNNILYNYSKIILILLVAVNIIQMVIAKLDSYIIPHFYESISNILFEKILKYYQNNYSDLELGKIGVRINYLPIILRELTTDLFNWIIPKICTLLIINFYLFSINIELGLLSLLLFLIIIIYNIINFNPCVSLSTKKYSTLEQKTEEMQDKLSNLYAIYSAGNVDLEIENYKKLNKEYKDIQTDSLNCGNDTKNYNNILILIIHVILSVYCIYLYKQNKISNETVISIFMILLFKYIPCLERIVSYLPEYTNHIGIIESLNDFMTIVYEKEIKKPDITITNGKIEIKNLKFSYNDNNYIFNNYNLTVNSNEKVAIVGKSGNGKSTLIKLIMGYYKIDDNMIFIDGQDINKYNLKSLRMQISFLNQNTKLFNKSIYENIKYGNTLTDEDINNLFIKFNLNKIFTNFKDGLDTIVGVNGDSLSGGQKQIIQLLRLYNKKNKIFILDEPTSALDIDTKNVITKIIKEISTTSTLIMITHDDKNLELVNKTIKIENRK